MVSNSQWRRWQKYERKERVQNEVYRRKVKKWEAREPARWRLIAHLRWKWEKPRYPLERR